MMKKTNQFISNELKDAIKKQNPYAKKGHTNALDAINLLEKTVSDATEDLENEIDRLDYSNINDESVYNTLAEQLLMIREKYALLPLQLREEVNSLSQSTFTITVFGRTMAGKSTLMETLIHGDGSSIGHGEQRKTRDVRRYPYKGVQLVDVPGVAAFDGKIDEEIAFSEAQKSDLIFFLMKDDDVQPTVAECLSKIIALGKPVVCLINVKIDIGSSELTPVKMKLFKRDLQKRYSPTHLEGIKSQLFEFGKSYGQDWHTIRFAYVHLQSAFLSQQKEYENFATELYELSKFNYIERVITEEVTNNGGFYKLKAFTEIVSIKLLESSEILFEQSAQNYKQGYLLQKKEQKLGECIKNFKRSADIQINTFIMILSSNLKKEASVFAEDNYDNKKASEKWNEVLDEFDIEKQAQDLLNKLGKECEIELEEFCQATKHELEFTYTLYSEKSLNMNTIVNSRRVWNWTASFLSGGLTIAGMIFVPTLIPIGFGVGILSILGNFLFEDYETKVKKAREKLEGKLIKDINEKMGNLEKALKQIVVKKLIKDYMNPVKETLHEIISSLFVLSDVQLSFGRKLNNKLLENNKLILTEALAYQNYQGLEYHINNVARIPGYAVMIVLDDGKRFPDDAKFAIKRILKEQIWFVFDNENFESMIGQAIGRNIDRREIIIDEEDGNPRIVHIPMIETVDSSTRNRIRMAQQLAGVLIMK